MNKQQPATTNQKNAAKTASITLRANGAILSLLAVRKDDGTAVTSVTTKDIDKKTVRGMTEVHKSLDLAKAHLEVLAKAAEKTGWRRGKFSMAAKPDAFAQIPAPPTTVSA